MAQQKHRGLRGLQALRTAVGSRLRSTPYSPGRSLIEAYMATKGLQLLENQLRSVQQRQARLEEALQNLKRHWGDTKVKDLLDAGIADSGASGDGTVRPAAALHAPKDRKRFMATVKLGY